MSVALIMNTRAKCYTELSWNVFWKSQYHFNKSYVIITTWQPRYYKTYEEPLDEKRKIRYIDFLKTLPISFIVNRSKRNVYFMAQLKKIRAGMFLSIN